MSEIAQDISKRKTFAIISHPDAGKTTITEKLLLFGGAIQLAGTVKSRKSDRHARSDWMKMEQERGISVSSSVMQFPYKDHIINLLDTPGHEDFSEDTYRTLTAVDSALMVIDVAKGVEQRTIKLMAICRLRDTPIISFINKLDREGKEPIDLLDEIEKILNIVCVPVTWPVGMGKSLKGIYNLLDDTVILFASTKGNKIQATEIINNINNPLLDEKIGYLAAQLREEIELIRGLTPQLDRQLFLAGKQTPVYFGSAINNFGVQQLLDGFCEYAPMPGDRNAEQRKVICSEKSLSGFVFKIQANMDPKHRDRIAFMRIVTGEFKNGMSIFHVRRKKYFKSAKALTFMANSRATTENAYAGDIIGLHNHGTIKIGDTFTEKEVLKFTGIPHFAPELFRRAQLRNPLKIKHLYKGLHELSEEGATQLFKPLTNNDMILGAVGVLQYEVVKQRLQDEYQTDVLFEPVNVNCTRWVLGETTEIDNIKQKNSENLALDIAGHLVYLAPSKINLELTIERWPNLKFVDSMEL